MLPELKRVCACLFAAVLCGGVMGGEEASLEARFRDPPLDASRPSLAVAFDPSGTGEEAFSRQLERARDLGAGGVLLNVPRADEALWAALGRAAEKCRRLGLELGLCDFALEEEKGGGRAQKLIWSASALTDKASPSTNAVPEAFCFSVASVELARLAAPPETNGVVHPQSIVDLTRGAAPTGGTWRVYRFGLADVDPPSADGFEGKAFFRHVNRVLTSCQNRFPNVYGNTLLWYQFAGVDRMELVWPRDLPELFLKRSGLTLMRYLPTLAGVPVGGEPTAAYVRKQVAQSIQDAWRERMARNVNELVHEAGLEAGIGIGDVPVGPEEVPLYFRRPTLTPARDEARFAANIRAAGAARALGRRFVIGRVPLGSVGATPAVALLPFPWKHEADRLLSAGATRLLVELDGGIPGEDAAFRVLQAGWTYARRCQLLLQHGEPVADFLVWTERVLPLLEGYACDYASQPVLDGAVVKNGQIRFDSERAYAALAVSGGVLGDKSAEQAVIRLAARGVHVWLVAAGGEGEEAVLARVLERAGAGCRVLRAGEKGVPVPDFQWRSETAGLRLRFLHRRTPGREIYFVVNDSAEAGAVTCVFRDAGAGVPARWDPVSGEAGLAVEEVKREMDGRVSVPLFMAPHDSCFIVFDRDGRMN